MAHGEINHIEFPADDPERAMAFYKAVAGWEFSAMDGMPN
jgi:predicted enzyme related to lactoylglutathione lyase